MGIAISAINPVTGFRFIDIASNRSFKRYWVSSAKELGLVFVPQFYCFPIYPADLEALNNELAVLRNFAIEHAVESIQFKGMASAIDELQDFLKAVDWQTEKVSIG